MDARAELEASIERTHEALADKAQQIEHRVVEVSQHVVHMLDARSRYRERPWPFLVTAALAGLVTAACWPSRSAGRP